MSTVAGWHPLGRPCPHRGVPCIALWATTALMLAGCSGFPLRPYDQMVHDVDRRTAALRDQSPALEWLNHAARLPGRSQAEIKTRIESLWQPSDSPAAWLNYNGLLATRYSQLDTRPGGMFVPGELTVRHLGADTRVRTIAAFHEGRRLPLVVGVSGINGTVEGKITVDILQSLYETGEFHVVHFESVTSVSHQVRNQRAFLGGFPEGLLIYQTVEALRGGASADSISQVHLLGVSYGGMLCGVAAQFEQSLQRGVIDGAVLALSAPVDLATLFDNLEVNRIIHTRVERGYLREGVRRFFRFGDSGLEPGELDRLSFDSYMRRLAFPLYRRVGAAMRREAPHVPEVATPQELYELSSVRPHLATLGVPFLMVQSYDDPVLSAEDHFAAVLRESPNPLLDGVLLRDGGHLGFDTLTRDPFTSQAAIEYFRYWSVPRE